MKRFGFNVAALLLVMHGVTVGMMTRTKAIRGIKCYKRSHCAAGIASRHNIGKNKETNEVTLILESLQIVEKDLKKQTKLLQSLQKGLAEVQRKQTKSYDLEIAKIEARCKVIAADLPYGYQAMMSEVDNMGRQ